MASKKSKLLDSLLYESSYQVKFWNFFIKILFPFVISQTILNQSNNSLYLFIEMIFIITIFIGIVLFFKFRFIDWNEFDDLENEEKDKAAKEFVEFFETKKKKLSDLINSFKIKIEKSGIIIKKLDSVHGWIKFFFIFFIAIFYEFYFFYLIGFIYFAELFFISILAIFIYSLYIIIRFSNQANIFFAKTLFHHHFNKSLSNIYNRFETIIKQDSIDIEGILKHLNKWYKLYRGVYFKRTVINEIYNEYYDLLFDPDEFDEPYIHLCQLKTRIIDFNISIQISDPSVDIRKNMQVLKLIDVYLKDLEIIQKFHQKRSKIENEKKKVYVSIYDVILGSLIGTIPIILSFLKF